MKPAKKRDPRAERDQAIREWAEQHLSEATLNLIRAANYDLYNGPLSQEESRDLGFGQWYGFSAACKAISSALDELPSTELWLTEDACISESEPRDEESPGEHPEDWIHYERSDVFRAIVGKELAPYL